MDELHTARLTLRAFTEDDVDFVHDMYARPEVQRYIGPTPDVETERDQAVARVRRYAGLRHPVYAIRLITDRADGIRYGTVLLKDLPASDGAASGETEIGWHLHPDAWGRGIATEAARAVLERGFADGLTRVLAVTHPDNTASQAVARRIGMVPRGMTDAYYGVTCALFSIERGA